jgi:hypothetical protein
MKKICIFLLITIATASIYGQNIYGPMTDYKGKPSASGRLLHEYLNPAGSAWQFECFMIENPDFVKWEIEKVLKKEVFKMDFFPNSYFTISGAMFYLMTKSEHEPETLDLLAQYYHTNKYSACRDMAAYILMKSSTQWEKKIANDLKNHGRNQKEIIQKYKNYEHKEKLDSEAVRRKVFDNYMKMFSKGRIGKLRNMSSFYDWINNWDICIILKEMLQENAVNSKNISLFCDFADYTDDIPNELAYEIIEYFKLDTRRSAKFPALTRLMGKNQKLDSALIKTFKNFKEKAVSKTKLSPDYILNYAQITGSYNRAFTAFLKRKKEFLQGYEVNLEAMDLICWNSAFALLCAKSNLSQENAVRIINKNAGVPKNWTCKPNPKFVKLIKPANFSSRISDKMPLGFSFPLNSLPPETLDFALKEYISIIKDPKRKDWNLGKIALENIMSLKSEPRRLKVIRELIHSNSLKPLQALSLEYLSELLKIASEKDPIAAVRACQAISSNGCLAISAAPELRKILNTQDDFTIKIAAMCALAEIGDKSSIKLMTPYLDNKNRLLARAAKQGVCMLQPFNKSDKLFNEMLKK